MFVTVDHCVTECVGLQAAKKATSFEALEPLRQGVSDHCGGFAPARPREPVQVIAHISSCWFVVKQAFLPNCNLLFLVCSAAYVFSSGAKVVAIGLLTEETHLFPDQTQDFLNSAEITLW